jgi:hypothetical protein
MSMSASAARMGGNAVGTAVTGEHDDGAPLQLQPDSI